jgi:hypothetical protein
MAQTLTWEVEIFVYKFPEASDHHPDKHFNLVISIWQGLWLMWHVWYTVENQQIPAEYQVYV